MICTLTGIELERERWMRARLDEFAQAGSYAELPEQWDVQAYFWQMVAKRLAHPQDELLDVLVAAWRDDKIDDAELLGYVYGFVTAGSDTTGTSFVNAFSLLAEFGELDYAQRVLDDEDAMRRIVEEVLRFGTPFPTKPLFVLADAQFGDLTVPQGSVLHVWFAAANRDEAVGSGVEQSSPDEFDPRRWPNRHLALGWGKHFCLGGDLSRLETRILLQEALRRLPGLELATDRPFVRFAGGSSTGSPKPTSASTSRRPNGSPPRRRPFATASLPGFCRRVGAIGRNPWKSTGCDSARDSPARMT